jgi:predicted RNA-binding Zn ribbon-like protein
MFETDKFSIIGNILFLDFVNTLKIRDGRPYETLEDFKDFLGWATAVKLLEVREASEVFGRWAEQTETLEFMRKARQFREILRDSAEKLARQKEIGAQVVAAVNENLRSPSGFTEIEKTGNVFEKRFRFDLDDPLKMLQPIAESFADFLCYGNFSLLRKCENSACVLYFYDTTKNHKRRWCSMKICGNQAKAAAFYRRNKASVEGK